MSSADVKKVPPDGGYGWVVTFAYALNNVVVLPLITSFMLVFQEAFAETGVSNTQGIFIVVFNHGFGMLLSFFGGPVLSRFGYRKVAVVGACFIAGGVMLTSYATTFWHFVLSYSIITSIGIASVMAAFTLAINSFFKEKRTRAVGVGMSLTGLGAIFTPLVIGALISAYGWSYTTLTLGALCLHSLLAACLLRPAKWYLKPAPVNEEMVPLNKDCNVELINGSVTDSLPQNGSSNLPRLDTSVDGVLSTTKSLSTRSLASTTSIQARNAISHPDLYPAPTKNAATYKWWESQEINLGSSINIFRENEAKANEVQIVAVKPESVEKKTFGRKIVDFFDLTLLKDPIFVNILIGLSIAACVETSFSLAFPLILKDMLRFDTAEISHVMAVIGASDTLFRLVSPFIGEWCHKPPRVMYIVALLMIIFTRTIMLFATTYMGMLFVALAIGVTKGVRTVYMNVIIPNHVPLERLPFASGIQMFINGVFTITLGTALGKLRDVFGTYHIPIIFLNITTLITIVMWTVELMYNRKKNQTTENV